MQRQSAWVLVVFGWSRDVQAWGLVCSGVCRVLLVQRRPRAGGCRSWLIRHRVSTDTIDLPRRYRTWLPLTGLTDHQFHTMLARITLRIPSSLMRLFVLWPGEIRAAMFPAGGGEQSVMLASFGVCWRLWSV